MDFCFRKKVHFVMDLSEGAQIGTHLKSASYSDQGKLNSGASSESVCSANKISKKREVFLVQKTIFSPNWLIPFRPYLVPF